LPTSSQELPNKGGNPEEEDDKKTNFRLAGVKREEPELQSKTEGIQLTYFYGKKER
jgi:hypothetical protein